MSQLANVMFDWVCEIPVTMSAELNGIGADTAIDWYECCRSVCSRTLMGMGNVLVTFARCL